MNENREHSEWDGTQQLERGERENAHHYYCCNANAILFPVSVDHNGFFLRFLSQNAEDDAACICKIAIRSVSWLG